MEHACGEPTCPFHVSLSLDTNYIGLFQNYYTGGPSNGLVVDAGRTGNSSDTVLLLRDASCNVLVKLTADGVLNFGTYAAKGTEVFDGFITIKDAAGNTRKIMTCA